MNKRRRDIRVALRLTLSLTLCFASGCAMLGGTRDDRKPFFQHHRATPVNAASLGSVNVGGQIRYPQQLELPPDGLDLRTAVQICGGAADGGEAEVHFASEPIAESREPSLAAAIHAVADKLALAEADSDRNELLISALKQVKSMIDAGADPGVVLSREIDRVRGTTDLLLKVAAIAELEDLRDDFLALAPSPSTISPRVMRSSVSRKEPMVVTLDRGSSLAQTTYHFLLDSILAGQVGPITLAAGDRVSLLPFDHTHFGQSSGRDGEVTMVGAVKQDRDPTVGGSPINTSATDAFIQGRIPIAAAAMQIERTKPNGVGKDFLVVPLDRAQSAEFANYEFHGEDVVTLAPVALLPLVRDSILQPVIAQRVRARTEEAMAQVQQRQEALLKRTANESMLDRTTRRFRRLGTVITSPPSLATLR